MRASYSIGIIDKEAFVIVIRSPSSDLLANLV
jgi:hypothetical protein